MKISLVVVACILLLNGFQSSIQEISQIQNLMLQENYQYIPLSVSQRLGNGFDLIKGHQICVTQECSLLDLKAPVFELKYASQPVECNKELILLPENSILQCLQNLQEQKHHTIEYISDIKKILNSKVNKSNLASDYKDSISLFHAKETVRILDPQVKNIETLYFNFIQVPKARITLNQTRSNLHHFFQMHVNWLPLQYNSDKMTQMIYRNFIDIFGFSYVSEIVIGGRVEKSSKVTWSNKKALESKGIILSTQSAIQFQLSINPGFADYNKDTQKQFVESSVNYKLKVLGGSVNSNTFQNFNYYTWEPTVMKNPELLSLSVRSISELFTNQYFPEDENINIKLQNLKRAFNAYSQENIQKRQYGRMNVDINCFNGGACPCKLLLQGGLCQDVPATSPAITYMCTWTKAIQIPVSGGAVAPMTLDQPGFEVLVMDIENNAYGLSLEYQVQNQNGWTLWVSKGKEAGTRSGITQTLNYITAIKVRLTGEFSSMFRIYYQTTCQGSTEVKKSYDGAELSGEDCKTLRLDYVIMNIEVQKNSEY